MLKKRVIFTLLYDRGHFMLSRNFRLQRVGDISWLQQNYRFSRIAFSIDELIVLDVCRGERDTERFCDSLKALTEGCFVPIAAGGGVRSVEHAHRLLRSGADKVVVNTAIFDAPALIADLAAEFGQQCIVASVDVKEEGDQYRVRIANGSIALDDTLRDCLARVASYPVGELYLNSMDRDGTGQGYRVEMLEHLPPSMPMPLILAGGAGNFHHLAAGLSQQRVDAVATAHLFNFVGDGLEVARTRLREQGFDLAGWIRPEDSETHLS